MAEVKKRIRARVLLVHWNAEEGKIKAAILRKLGYDVRLEKPEGQAFFKRLRAYPPDAVVIDLSRLPSQGRDIGIAVRHYKSTRGLPLILAGGDPVKAAQIGKILPDSAAADWDSIGQALKRAIRNPPRDPVKPASLFAGYAGAPLAKKLSIGPDAVVGLIDAPDGFESSVDPLPKGARFIRDCKPKRDLTIWFTKSAKELETGLKKALGESGEGRLWIAWPKKGPRLQSDLTQQTVREAGLAAGWVDYKICSIDAIWSALLFTKRKSVAKGGKR